ncbi:tRNA pseudouridine(38-40) synthase TruA [Clostridium tyrobutyricum]|uniref:tRNA pseudouridine(38-40) synthase TruA n=1 Tax=Clostridium tyrobutyricum TaxID=1519 RepID=UPI001C38B3AD|nr:tRNA pseudouridine(38-40) synthase TruA [Clostridium tyrobutyricum]MBV4416831.1 tRNA pseudouridine(38-40) synthase TruA [Clostridium tyrobutyricum]MBV4422236.1 tRNA pseudouridine(38-40) synthase TruA [Clostridium tyrobutyricum]MBV4446543.1 tRNA pseudouridine(38-40) synthase TruA [Clostridium tyrobutyricum]
MKNIKLVIEYDGTNYSGWQRQKNAMTIQEKLEMAIQKSTGKYCNTIGCSRTDSGVHARQFTCNFLTDSKIPSSKFKMVLNSQLPEDIVVLKSEEVDINFHSRYNTIGKEYSYTIIIGNNRPAIGRNYIYYFQRRLNIDNMKTACKFFIGKHDFSAFKSNGSSAKTSVRTIKKFTVSKQENLIKFIVTGDGFLYNMVRIMVGTLLEVGVGRFSPEYVLDILRSKDRSKAGKPAPGRGLCLEKVFY